MSRIKLNFLAAIGIKKSKITAAELTITGNTLGKYDLEIRCYSHCN